MSRVEGKVESKVEGLKMSLKVRKKTKTSAIRIFFSTVSHKKWIINNIVCVSNEMLCQSSCVTTLEI